MANTDYITLVEAARSLLMDVKTEQMGLAPCENSGEYDRERMQELHDRYKRLHDFIIHVNRERLGVNNE